MPISSMTGFARQNGECNFEDNSYQWFFEIKSVNGKSLDIKTKLPSWLDYLSNSLKATAAKFFVRGNVSVYLDITSSKGNEKVKINEELLAQLLDKAVDVYQSSPNVFNKPSASEILALRGVIDIEDDRLSEDKLQILQTALVKSFEEVCKSLQSDRCKEGEKIKQALLDIVAKIDNIVLKVEKIAQQLPEKLKERLYLQIEELLGKNSQISEERLVQEVTLYVAKADIREEIDRLKAHLKTAKELLAFNEAVGRRLDFLCQELNREANTTCSKSCDIELTNLGMELKTLIEQLREQVQNME